MSEVAMVFFDTGKYELHTSTITKARMGSGLFFATWFKYRGFWTNFLRDTEHNSHDAKRK